MSTFKTISILLGSVALGLVGCAPRRVAMVPPPPPPAVVAQKPVAPSGFSTSAVVPPRLANGRYQTINYGIGPAQTVWHLRSALNVAALACRGADETAIIGGYNALLRLQKAVLAQAHDRTVAEFRAQGGPDWQTTQDAHMTRVYNFFAQPEAKQAFCKVAADVLAQANATAPAAFETFAPDALRRLEAPFTQVYAAYDAYRHDLAAWQNGQRSAVAMFLPASPSIDSGSGAARTPRLSYAALDQVIDWQPR